MSFGPGSLERTRPSATVRGMQCLNAADCLVHSVTRVWGEGECLGCCATPAPAAAAPRQPLCLCPCGCPENALHLMRPPAAACCMLHAARAVRHRAGAAACTSCRYPSGKLVRGSLPATSPSGRSVDAAACPVTYKLHQTWTLKEPQRCLGHRHPAPIGARRNTSRISLRIVSVS